MFFFRYINVDSKGRCGCLLMYYGTLVRSLLQVNNTTAEVIGCFFLEIIFILVYKLYIIFVWVYRTNDYSCNVCVSGRVFISADATHEPGVYFDVS